MAGLDDYNYGPKSHINSDDYPANWNTEFDQVYEYSRRPYTKPTPLNFQSEFTRQPITIRPSRPLQDEEDEFIEKYMRVGVGVATLITENLLCHPFIVLRRQCQVHNKSRREHLLPFTLIPVIYRLNQRQGITKLWKGLGSALVVRGMTLAIEDAITKFTPWPKDMGQISSWTSCCQHVLLKCITLAIVTPFYSASLVETVQSDITSEKPGIFDVFKEGVCRLVSWGCPMKGRMLPIWKLVLPTVAFGLFKYAFTELVRNCTSSILQLSLIKKRKNQGALPKDLSKDGVNQEIEMTSSLMALFAAEVLFYPFETVLHRLHLQGTRTIIDNLDSGREVIPILTSYEGALDCYRTALREEGASGLYKGFGALVLQLVAHTALVHFTKYVLTHTTQLFRGSSPPPPDILKQKHK